MKPGRNATKKTSSKRYKRRKKTPFYRVEPRRQEKDLAEKVGGEQVRVVHMCEKGAITGKKKNGRKIGERHGN